MHCSLTGSHRHGKESRIISSFCNGKTLIASKHLEGLRKGAEGAQVRQDTKGKERGRAKPHSTSAENPGAILDKLWRKGACLGRKLLCRASRPELEWNRAEGLPGVEESPNGAVPKQNPDRTVSEEVRVIWDLRINNADGNVLNHPPALTPRHRELGRGIIWWSIRLPGVVVLMVKLDVAGAFTLVWLRPQD